MAFFKKYHGTTDKRLLRIERWTWILIYGGLLTSVVQATSSQIQASTVWPKACI
jgi:hypothetical protein